MYIKSMVVDGFKSYGQRTEINGFDPMFNAITGLNGSGKSNILDAICFLLGITNLTHVRATNLQELVYKSGQAGVTKATVTVTFDNKDKKQSPIGYEHYDEVTVTRQVSELEEVFFFKSYLNKNILIRLLLVVKTNTSSMALMFKIIECRTSFDQFS